MLEWQKTERVGFIAKPSMHLSHLSLTNIRNYSRLEFDIPSGTTLLYGNNAQGKTNILEAIYYLATTRSPFAEHDSQIINWVSAQSDEPIVVGRIKATIHLKQNQDEIEIRLIQENKVDGVRSSQKRFRREVLFNRRKVRLMDLLGNLRIVMFLPSDIQMITGSPSERRRYLNITLCQVDPVYCRTLSNYNKILEQRNALLRQIGEGLADKNLLAVYDEKLIQYGSLIFCRRASFLDYMTQKSQKIHYESLTKGHETIQIVYLPKLLSNKQLKEDSTSMRSDWLIEHQEDGDAVSHMFMENVSQNYDHDIARGTTSVGPHRDDWQIQLDQHNLGPFGSRGQQRSAILALKMAEIEWMQFKTGENPILLLDEVVAELDEFRRQALLDTVLQSNQAILTATDPNMFTNEFIEQAHCFHIENGRIQ